MRAPLGEWLFGNSVTIMLVGWLAFLGVDIAVVAAVLYVAWHFISRFW